MTTNHERRSRLMGFKIKQTSWDLEDLKQANRNAIKALELADKKLNEVEAVIGETEKTIRKAMDGEISMDLEVIEAARQFLSEQQTVRQQRSNEQRNASQKLDQAESKLKQTALYVKALEQIKESSDQELGRQTENRIAEQIADLWLQRYGKE